ncbi:MAG: hypothetical protein C4318_01760 [Acidimicrobiia bacterium]
MIWTGIFGSLPYVVFVASARIVDKPGIGPFAGAILGSLPIGMLLAPFIGLYMVIKRFSRFLTESTTDSRETFSH